MKSTANDSEGKGIELLKKAMYLYKLNFDKVAQKHGGTITWLAQYTFLQAGVNGKQGFLNLDHQPKPGSKIGIDKSQYSGVCAGLAMEWLKDEAKINSEELKHFSRGVVSGSNNIMTGPFNKPKDFIGSLKQGQKDLFTQSRTEYLNQLITRIQTSHEQQSSTEKIKENLKENLILLPEGEKTFKYPFSGMAKHFRSRVRNKWTKRYYYISTTGHALACSASALGKIDFYDPNIGLLQETKESFVQDYLKSAIDSTVKFYRDYLREDKNDDAKINSIAPNKVITVHAFDLR